ncbi:unnamed protein product [Schistosoma turkestanicum]|nr:unnamed protein product [Schistosoma turkestanicum]
MNTFYVCIINIILTNLSSIQCATVYQQPQQIYPTDFQSLNLGSCLLNGGDVFCQKYRRHSFCSIKHDECFCLPGYVSVYEMQDSWYTCKLLLTDLYCRIDSDCSFIHGSICHPGVGACVCPSGYEFVFQHFSCLPRVIDNSNPFCKACQKHDGVCVLKNTRKQDSTFNDYYQNNLQCACPRRSNRSVIKKDSYFDICNPIPVDIGEECDHVNKVCFSQRAMCLQNPVNIFPKLHQTQLTTNQYSNICVCHEGMIPVYQNNLDYFECFIEETDPTITQCQPCYQSHARCYQLLIGSSEKNASKIKYRCSCSLLFKQNTFNPTREVDKYQCPQKFCSYHHSTMMNGSVMPRIDHYQQPNQLSRSSTTNKENCIEYSVQITCNQEMINICFKLLLHPNRMIRNVHKIENLIIYLETSTIENEFNYAIMHDKLKLIQQCYLTHQNHHHDGEYCSMFNLRMNTFKQCGIYEISYKYGSVFHGTLHAGIMKNEAVLMRKIHIDFACHVNTSYSNELNQSVSYFYDRSITYEKQTSPLKWSQKSSEINNNFHATESAKQFIVHNDRKYENINSNFISLSIIHLTKNTSEKHELILKITSELSEFILIEYCLVKGELTTSSKILLTSDNEKYLDLKCLHTNIYRIKQIIDIFNHLSGYQCILFKRPTIMQERTQNNNQSVWISEPFIVGKNISFYNSIYFTCLIRICQMEQLCTYASFYSFNKTNEHQFSDQYLPSNVYIPLIILNQNRNETNLLQLLPPENMNKLIQFHFIQSVLITMNQTSIGKHLNNPIDIHFRHTTTTNVNKSQQSLWIYFILALLIFIFLCQIIICLLKYFKKKYYAKYRLANHRNPFVIAMNTIQQSINRNLNSKQTCQGGHAKEDIYELHDIDIVNEDAAGLNNETNDTKCCTIELDRHEHQYQQQHHSSNALLNKPQQTSHSMTCLLVYPFNKPNKCFLLHDNTTLHYRNLCLPSSIHCRQHNFNHSYHNHVSHFATVSRKKSQNIELLRRISKSTLNIATNEIKAPTEHSTLNKYNELIHLNNKNHPLTNHNCTHRNIFLPTSYHNDYLKQQQRYPSGYPTHTTIGNLWVGSFTGPSPRIFSFLIELHFTVQSNLDQYTIMHCASSLHKFPLLRNLNFGRVQCPISRFDNIIVQPFICQSTQSSSLNDTTFVPGPKMPSTWWPHQPLVPGRRVARLYPVRYLNKTRIALVREGCVNRPFFTIQIKSNLAESKQKGIEQVGSWDPFPNIHGEQLIALNFERISYWLGMGAEPTVRVAELLGLCGFLPVHPRSYLMAHRARIAMAKYLARVKQQTTEQTMLTDDDKEAAATTLKNVETTDDHNDDDDSKAKTGNADIYSRVDSIWRKGNEPPDWWHYGLP